VAEKANTQMQIFSTPQHLGNAAAEYVARLSAQAVEARGRFTVALSGGSLIKLLCPPLVADPLLAQINWPAWHVFWADERCVPLDHPDSNYRLAREHLFDYVDIPPAHIHPIDDSLAPAQAADAYQTALQQLFQPEANQPPRFDLILLGMGDDGHTASLFPGHPLLTESERWVAPIFDSPKPPPERITLTLPVINNARHVAFVTAGSSKAPVLAHVMGPATGSSKLPVQMVQPANLQWFLDNAAAANWAP